MASKESYNKRFQQTVLRISIRIELSDAAFSSSDRFRLVPWFREEPMRDKIIKQVVLGAIH